MNYTKPNLTITALGTEYNTSMTSKCMIRVITAQLSKVILTFENWAVITHISIQAPKAFTAMYSS